MNNLFSRANQRKRIDDDDDEEEKERIKLTYRANHQRKMFREKTTL